MYIYIFRLGLGRFPYKHSDARTTGVERIPVNGLLIQPLHCLTFVNIAIFLSQERKHPIAGSKRNYLGNFTFRVEISPESGSLEFMKSARVFARRRSRNEEAGPG